MWANLRFKSWGLRNTAGSRANNDPDFNDLEFLPLDTEDTVARVSGPTKLILKFCTTTEEKDKFPVSIE
jgi:hypothetical protein